MAYFTESHAQPADGNGLGQLDRHGPAVTSLRMRPAPDAPQRSPVRARILWPTLGFPAVIAPRTPAGTSSFVEGDASRCICVLLLSDRRWLSKAEVARYLRCVPWAQRARRHIPAGQPGSFREEEIAVHNPDRPPPLEHSRPKDRLGGLVSFGANAGGGNGIAASLANHVREFYRRQGLEHLHEDRNWFLFYYLLASGGNYSKPVYTILGNHDWRLNSYPPFALAGPPDPATMFPDAIGFTGNEQKSALQQAHGRGHDRAVSYNDAVESRFRLATRHWLRIVWNVLTLRRAGRTIVSQALRKVFGGEKTLDLPGLPTETTVESIAWYLHAINPFLDYRFTLPRGHGVLMLDWAEDENVFFGAIHQGKRYLALDKDASDEGPNARNSLTDLQVALVQQFTDAPGAAKIIGVHAPPISPWYDWDDGELAEGWKTFDLGSRGYPHYTRRTSDGRSAKGHPLSAIRPARGVVPDAVHGMDASYNTFERNRSWFIKHLTNPRYGVRLVLSGHVHRRGLYVVHPAPDNSGPPVAGELLMRSVREQDVRGVRAPAGALSPVPGRGGRPGPAPGPLYVVATSVGPRGHSTPVRKRHFYVDPGYTHIELANDGTIRQVAFRWVSSPQRASLRAPVAVATG